MRKPLEVWQFIISLIILVMSGGTLVVNQSNKITDQNARIITLEQNRKDTERQFDKVNERLDRMSDKLTDILVELQNKKDRNK